MRWINLLHFYQPANIDFFSIKEALDKSYYRLLRLMEENQELKMTWNISGCLLERLQEEKEFDFIERLKKLVDLGKVEIVSSAAYHPLLPLIPEDEVVRQIKENEQILKQIFGRNFKAKGFFLPEMAYSSKVGVIIKKLGYEWVILDELAFDGGKTHPNLKHYYLDQANNLKIVFRNHVFSRSYPPEKLLKELSKNLKNKLNNNLEKNIITATDAELYGLRHEDPTGDLEKIARLKEVTSLTISSFIDELDKANFKPEEIKVISCSWETQLKDIVRNEPFKLWLAKGNKIQKYLWQLSLFILAIEDTAKEDKNYYWYRWHLVRGLASCTFWWASAHDFSKVFGPYAWNPDVVDRGLEDLIRAMRSLENKKMKKNKIKAEAYYLKIKKLVWEEHWKKHW